MKVVVADGFEFLNENFPKWPVSRLSFVAAKGA